MKQLTTPGGGGLLWQLTFISILLSISCCSVEGTNTKGDVPLVLWSAEGYLSSTFGPTTASSSVTLDRTISATQVGDLLKIILTNVKPGQYQELSQVLNFENPPLPPQQQHQNIKQTQQGPPEVLVVFLEEKLRSEYLSLYKESFSGLRSILKTEKTQQLYAPFVNIEDGQMDLVIHQLIETTRQHSGQVYYVGDEINNISWGDDITFVPLQNLEDTMKLSGMLTNTHTDLIIVPINGRETDFKTSDLVILSVNNLISKYSSKYVSAYVARTYDTPHWYTKFSDQKRFVSQHPSPQPSPQPSPSPTPTPTPTNGTEYNTFQTYFGGWFWELFLVCSVLIPLMIMGIFSIDSIQTPIFDEKKKK